MEAPLGHVEWQSIAVTTILRPVDFRVYALADSGVQRGRTITTRTEGSGLDLRGWRLAFYGVGFNGLAGPRHRFHVVPLHSSYLAHFELLQTNGLDIV